MLSVIAIMNLRVSMNFSGRNHSNDDGHLMNATQNNSLTRRELVDFCLYSVYHA